MSALLGIYGLAILASALFAAVLAVIGAHLATRDRAVQTLCVSQGAMVGVLGGLALTATVFQEDVSFQGLPYAGAVLCSAAAYFGSERLVRRVQAGRSAQFAALFTVLLGCASLIASLVPSLEAHMAQRYFGDLATLSPVQAWEMLGAAAALALLLIRRRQAMARLSFDSAVLGSELVDAGVDEGWVPLATLLALCFAVQVGGLLYTLACLFVPTALAARRGKPGLRRHLWRCVLIGGGGMALGFTASLLFPHLPVVPSGVLGMVAVGRAAGSRQP